MSKSLDELLGLDMVAHVGSPAGYSPVDPRSVVGAHIARERKNLANRELDLTTLEADVATLSDVYELGRARVARDPSFTVVAPIEHIGKELARAGAQAQSEISVAQLRDSLGVNPRTEIVAAAMRRGWL